MKISKTSISKEELEVLPLETLPAKIVVIDKNAQISDAIKELKKSQFVGFDTETKPAFQKGQSNKVALLQLATTEVCYLFRLNKLTQMGEIFRFLSSTKITKIGLSIRNDFSALRKLHDFKPAGFIDIQEKVGEKGITDLSLQKIYALLFSRRISKGQRLSNWEAETLSASQQHYAGLDAWSCLKIYFELQKYE